MEETPGYGRSGRLASPGRGRSRRPALSVQRPLLSHQGELRCVHEAKPPSAESDLGNLDSSVIRFTPIGSEGWVTITAGHLGHDTNCDHPVSATKAEATMVRVLTKLHAVVFREPSARQVQANTL